MTASTNSQNVIYLDWLDAADNGSPIIRYEIYRDGSLLATTGALTYQDVIGGAGTFSYYVIGVNAVGDGPPSTIVTGTATP